MNRRTAFKNIIVASGTLITVPAWMQGCGLSDSNTHNSSFSAGEQNMLSAIANAIIPAGNSIGALSVGVDKYLQKLLDDCYEQPDKDNFKKQLAALDAASNKAYSQLFSKCTQKQQQDALIAFGNSTVKEEKDFFNFKKTETIHGFNTSQKVMEGYLNYKVAPGHYYGCVNA